MPETADWPPWISVGTAAEKVQGQFGTSSTCGSRVAPGANCTINATFARKSIGLKTGTISVIDTASTKPQVIELTGAGTVVRLSPMSLTFGSQTVGTRSTPQQIDLINTGLTPLNVSRVTFDGKDPGDFSQDKYLHRASGGGRKLHNNGDV